MQDNWTTFLDRSERLYVALGDRFPVWSEGVREQAEHALRGEICKSAAGEWAAVGRTEIDWSCKSMYNPPQVEMALRRYQMLQPLVAAWRATGDRRYADNARHWIEQFLIDHPTREDWAPLPGDGATQYDLRVGSFQNPGWLGTLWALAASDAFDTAFCQRVIEAVAAHIRHLADHVYEDRNIRTLHGEVLLLTGWRLPFLPDAEQWLKRGVRILNDAVRRQVLPDGAHMEATPGYHGVVLDVFENAWQLAQGLPELGLRVPTETVARMHDYLIACTRPDGVLVPLHDTRYPPAKAPGNTTHADRRLAFREAAGLPPTPPPTSAHFPVASQIFLRDGWHQDATYIAFDAARRSSYHWHPCRNSFQLSAHGRALLVDPGYIYTQYGHRTAHHNTITLNDYNQSHAGTELRHAQVPGYDLIEGHYDGGYWPQPMYSHGDGIFAEHARALLWLRDRFIVVLDNLYATSEAGKKPAIACVWQLSEGPAAMDAERGRAVTQHDEANLLLLWPVTPAGTQATMHTGTESPRRGWLVSDWGRSCVPAPMVRLCAQAYDPWQADLATVLIPFAGAEAPVVTAEGVGPDVTDPRGAGRLTLTWGDGTTDTIAWTRRLAHAIDGQHGLDTDASLVHLQRDATGRPSGGLMIDGTYLEANGSVIADLQRLDRLS